MSSSKPYCRICRGQGCSSVVKLGDAKKRLERAVGRDDAGATFDVAGDLLDRLTRCPVDSWVLIFSLTRDVAQFRTTTAAAKPAC